MNFLTWKLRPERNHLFHMCLTYISPITFQITNENELQNNELNSLESNDGLRECLVYFYTMSMPIGMCVYFGRRVVDRCVLKWKENSCSRSSTKKKKKSERELWKCSLKCVRAQRRLSLSLLASMMHFEIPLKTSAFDTRRVKESMCVCAKRNEKGETKKHERIIY